MGSDGRADVLATVVTAAIVGLPLVDFLFWDGDPVDVALVYLFLIATVLWVDR